MAAYRRVDDAVTCGLTARTPGSAPGPTLGIEYGTLLPYLPLYKLLLGLVQLGLLLVSVVQTSDHLHRLSSTINASDFLQCAAMLALQALY